MRRKQNLKNEYADDNDGVYSYLQKNLILLIIVEGKDMAIQWKLKRLFFPQAKEFTYKEDVLNGDAVEPFDV